MSAHVGCDNRSGRDGNLVRMSAHRGVSHCSNIAAAGRGAGPRGAVSLLVHAARSAAVLGSGHRGGRGDIGARDPAARVIGRRSRRRNRRRPRPVYRGPRCRHEHRDRRDHHLDAAGASVALAASGLASPSRAVWAAGDAQPGSPSAACPIAPEEKPSARAISRRTQWSAHRHGPAYASGARWVESVTTPVAPSGLGVGGRPAKPKRTV